MSEKAHYGARAAVAAASDYLIVNLACCACGEGITAVPGALLLSDRQATVIGQWVIVCPRCGLEYGRGDRLDLAQQDGVITPQ
jgi:hypothetical protein